MDATFWALIALLLFFAIVIYLKIPGKVTAHLDKRADKIRQELNDARKLREEAQALLADFQRKRKAAQSEADDIIAQAKAEAEQMTEEANTALKEMIERRTRAAELKITQAESQAVDDVRDAAAEVAIMAAEKLLTTHMQGTAGEERIAKSIADIQRQLN